MPKLPNRQSTCSAFEQLVFSWEERQMQVLAAEGCTRCAAQVGMPFLRILPAVAPHLRRISLLPQKTEARRIRRIWSNLTKREDNISYAICQLPDLPLASQSIDLLILPHGLEQTVDSRQLLREAYRVLAFGGRLLLSGFSSQSLWGLHQSFRCFTEPTDNRVVSSMNVARVKDWLRLLNFELVGGQFGCYRPPFANERWIKRLRFLEAAGERWWPTLGSAYLLVATKKTIGVCFSGLRPEAEPRFSTPWAPAAQKDFYD